MITSVAKPTKLTKTSLTKIFKAVLAVHNSITWKESGGHCRWGYNFFGHVSRNPLQKMFSTWIDTSTDNYLGKGTVESASVYDLLYKDFGYNYSYAGLRDSAVKVNVADATSDELTFHELMFVDFLLLALADELEIELVDETVEVQIEGEA